MKATSFSSSISSNLGNSGEEIHNENEKDMAATRNFITWMMKYFCSVANHLRMLL